MYLGHAVRRVSGRIADKVPPTEGRADQRMLPRYKTAEEGLWYELWLVQIHKGSSSKKRLDERDGR